MKPTRELVKLTLASLTEQLVHYQIGLKMIGWEIRDRAQELADMTAEQARMRSLVEGIHNKIQWEMNKHHHLIGFERAEDGNDLDIDGEAWKTA